MKKYNLPERVISSFFQIIAWFASPGDTTLFHPKTIEFLEEGLKFSKKEKNIRRAELFEAVEQPLCEAIVKNPSFWLRGGHTGLATAAILKNSKGECLKLAYDCLADIVCDPEWKVNEKEVAQKVEGDEDAKMDTKKINKKKVIVNPLAEVVSAVAFEYNFRFAVPILALGPFSCRKAFC